MTAFFRILLPLILVTTFISCKQGCMSSKGIDKGGEASTNDKEYLSDSEINELAKHTNIKDLDPLQVGSFVRFLSEEICPCGCPSSFADCIKGEDNCKPGQMLANWTIKQLRRKAPEMYLYPALTEEINDGYLKEPRKINTKGAYRKGDKDAPITLVEFADFECPACKLTSAQIKKFVESNPNDVQLYFIHFPLSNHLNAERAAIAAEAAGLQGKFWQMHDLLFASQQVLTKEHINELAAIVFNNKKSLEKFKKDCNNKALLEKVRSNKKYAMEELQLDATPTIMFNGRPYNLSSTQEGFQLRLEMEKIRDTIKCGS